MKIYTELLKVLVAMVILNYFLGDNVNMGTLFLLSFLVVYAGTIVTDICLQKIEMFQNQQTNEISKEITRQDVQKADKQEAEIVAKVLAENPNSVLLTQDNLSWVNQIDKTKAGTLDPLYNATFSLSCVNNVSAGSQGWLCTEPSLQDNLNTRGGNRGQAPINEV